MAVLLAPPVAGQAVGEWAKQQACRKQIFETDVLSVAGFEEYLVAGDEVRSEEREHRAEQRVTESLSIMTDVVALGAAYWEGIRHFAESKRLLSSMDATALRIACAMPRKLPTDSQAERLMSVRARCEEAGFSC